jgi:hypothetical protein
VRFRCWTNANRQGKIYLCSRYLSCRGRKGDDGRCESLTRRRGERGWSLSAKFFARVWLGCFSG